MLLMLDETIITETPPLYCCYGHIGEQVRVLITGNRSKRILHGAINVQTGDVSLLITKEWTKETHQTIPLGDPMRPLAGLEGSYSSRTGPVSTSRRTASNGPRSWASRSVCSPGQHPS